MSTATTTKFLTISEVAARLHIHRATVYRRIHEGVLKVSANFGTGRGSAPRISEDDLQAYINSRSTRATR